MYLGWESTNVSPASVCRHKWLFQPALSAEQRANLPEATVVSELLGDPFKWRKEDGNTVSTEDQ